MKLLASFSVSTLMYLEAFKYIPMIDLILNLYFPVLGEKTLGSAVGVERRAGNFLSFFI
jgi:hypothetical protein